MEFPFFVRKRVLPTEASLYYLSPLVFWNYRSQKSS